MQSIYVGNLSWGITSVKLQQVFEKVGEVTSSRVITDRETGRSKGFGFVEMSPEDADRAVSELNGQEVEGRPLKVNLAEDKKKTNSFSSGPNNHISTKRSDFMEPVYSQGFESKPRGKKSWGKKESL